MEVIDLGDPLTLRELVGGNPSYFFTEITTGEDSDVEVDTEEGRPDQSRVLPIHRVPLDSDSDSEEEEDEGRQERWREGATTPPPVTFTGDSGIQVPVPDDPTPLDFFQMMVSDDMVENIVRETNRYASQSMVGKSLSPHSRFRKWVDVTVQEMYGFFGLIIAMGLIIIEDLDEYWSMDEIFNLPLFRSVMKRDRFCLIMSFLHLCDNDDQLDRDHPDHDPLFKIRGFVDQLVHNFRQTFVPGPKIAIDEAMVAWRGHLSFRVYNPDKPCKFGIKAFELCDSDTGYCSNLEFYTGKKEVSPMGATFDVVNRLVQPYLGCGRTLFVDNYYTSHDLFTFLRRNDTLACGTLRLNRRNGPPKDMIPKLKKTDTGLTALTNGTLNLLRFHDKREVNILTTAHDAGRVNTGKVNPVTKDPIVKLKAVHEYNKFMGAVDRSDQMVTYNAFKRRTLKWWKKTFFHLFMLGVVNSYIVYSSTTSIKKLSHKIFRRDLAKQLISFMPMALPRPRLIEIGDTSLMRLTARHFPQLILPKPGAKLKNPQRDCVVCSEPATGKRKHSRYECRCCNVGLHVDPCFKMYHTYKDFKRALKRKRDIEEN